MFWKGTWRCRSRREGEVSLDICTGRKGSVSYFLFVQKNIRLEEVMCLLKLLALPWWCKESGKYGATNQCFQHPCIHRAYPGDADHEHVNLKKEKPAMPHGFRSLEWSHGNPALGLVITHSYMTIKIIQNKNKKIVNMKYISWQWIYNQASTT